MNTGFNTEKGSITLETAIFLPVFFLAVITLGSFIKIVGVNENLTHAVMDETNKLMSQAYIIKAAPGFPGNVESRIAEENPRLQEIELSKFSYLYQDFYEDSLISFQVKGAVKVKLPLGFHQGYVIENRIKCRGFVGKKNRNDIFSFDDMEKDGDSNIVWVFPMSGKRYHNQTCGYVKANPTQQVLNQLIRQRYKPCKLCKPEELINGAFVYCFLKSGEVYHKADCKTVDKYTVEIEKEEALEKGYTPCSKCEGG